MRVSKLLFILNLLLLPTLAIAKKCIKDILSFSQSADSLLYETQSESANLNIPTNLATHSQLDWVVYCPNKKLEVHPFMGYRFLRFQNNQRQIYFDTKNQEVSLLSFGVNGKAPVGLLNSKYQIPYQFKMFQDLLLNNEGEMYRFQKLFYTELELGIERDLWSQELHSIIIALHAGLFTSLNSITSFGRSVRIGSEYNYRWSERFAISLNAYYINRYQKMVLSNQLIQGASTQFRIFFRL